MLPHQIFSCFARIATCRGEQNLLARRPKRVQNDGMNTPPRRWPDNVKQLRLAGLAAGGLDQKMMVTLRRLADRTGETVEFHLNRAIVDFVERCQAERELSTKIIPFPRQNAVCEVRRRKDHLDVDLISDALPFGRLCYSEQSGSCSRTDGSNYRGDKRSQSGVTNQPCVSRRSK